MTKQNCELDVLNGYDLRQRWPDSVISQSCQELIGVYRGLVEERLATTPGHWQAIRNAYEAICNGVASASAGTPPLNANGATKSSETRLVFSYVISRLKTNHPDDWIQSIASLLGMLMHFSPARSGARFLVNRRRPQKFLTTYPNSPQFLVNRRRPQKFLTTYPNSPQLAMLVGDAVIAKLLKQPPPLHCRCQHEAETYVERAFNFRILDPSMESGQLLLEVARAAVRYIHRTHPQGSQAAKNIIGAALRKLCRDCLWGIDQNELARPAVAAVFSLLGSEWGIRGLVPKHLLTQNTLMASDGGALGQFDAVINNPPWGELLTPTERQRVRAQFETLQHETDTYVAFCEFALNRLRQGGCFALIIPSQFVAARNGARLRAMFADHTRFDRIVLLPRSAFAEATVRGLLLTGRKLNRVSSPPCTVTVFPMVKKINGAGPARNLIVPNDFFDSLREQAWSRLFVAAPDERSLVPADCVALERVARVVSGLKAYGKGKGTPPQTAQIVRTQAFTFSRPRLDTVPAIRGREVRRFHLAKPREFISLGCWLANVGEHQSLRGSSRVFLREICRRDGRMTAAVSQDGIVPLHGVLTVIPTSINIHVLTGLLNSANAAQYVRTNTASFSKVDFQKITLTELRKMPIPLAALTPKERAALGLGRQTKMDAALHHRLKHFVKRILQTDSENEGESLLAALDKFVASMFTKGSNN